MGVGTFEGASQEIQVIFLLACLKINHHIFIYLEAKGMES